MVLIRFYLVLGAGSSFISGSLKWIAVQSLGPSFYGPNVSQSMLSNGFLILFLNLVLSMEMTTLGNIYSSICKLSQRICTLYTRYVVMNIPVARLYYDSAVI